MKFIPLIVIMLVWFLLSIKAARRIKPSIKMREVAVSFTFIAGAIILSFGYIPFLR